MELLGVDQFKTPVRILLEASIESFDILAKHAKLDTVNLGN
jgi:hypothetical protein